MLHALRDWLPAQRWFPADDTGTTSVVDAVPLVVPAPGRAALYLLRVGSAPGLVQVPIAARPEDGVLPEAAAPPEAAALPEASAPPTGSAGTAADTRPGDPARPTAPIAVAVVDGVRWALEEGAADTALLQAWLSAADAGPGDGRHLSAVGARVLAGEQSNTSVVLPRAHPPAILKVFRVVTPGPHPDVLVPQALRRVGWDGVPAVLARLEVPWPADDAPSGETCHLGVLTELVEDAADGFRLACDHAREQRDLAPLARDLGARIAGMHAALRTALPDAVGTLPAATVLERLRARAQDVLAAVPALDELAAAVHGLLDATAGALAGIADLPVQHVHGDLHLGQVLHSARRGWQVLDFEGEPAAPAHERMRPDLALRDVAGMLRSFDYAARIGGAEDPEWAARARTALQQGYASVPDGSGPRSEVARSEVAPSDVARPVPDPSSPPSAVPPAAPLLRALELDKALYEVRYEQQHRPDWVPVPLAAVRRLVGS